MLGKKTEGMHSRKRVFSETAEGDVEWQITQQDSRERRHSRQSTP